MRKLAIPLCLVLLSAVGCSSRLYEVRTDKALFLETLPGQKVYVKVTNTSLLKDFPLEQAVRSRLTGKGYVLVSDPAAADVVLRANVSYSGLIEPAVKGDKTAAGALLGGAVGGAGVYAGSKSGSGAIGGAIAGSLIGAGLGYWMERSDMKNTFLTTVEIRVEEKVKKKQHEAAIHARVRDKDLTLQSAGNRVLPDIADQIAGHF